MWEFWYLFTKFADDQVVMAQSKEDLEYMCRKLQEEYSKWRLALNIAKTNTCLGTDTNNLEMENGDIINGCTEYKYQRQEIYVTG